MKFINYALAVFLGALVAILATQRLADHTPTKQPILEGSSIVSSVESIAVPPAAEPADGLERERLLRENAELKAELNSLHARLVQHDATLKQTAEQLEDLRRPMVADIMSSTLRAELKSGEVVITGGYKLADGRRLYAFAKPSVEQVEGEKMIRIEGRYLTLTDEVGQTVGLENLATNAANTLQHGEVWAPVEEREVLSKLQATAGTEVLEYPGISLESGRSGTISIGNTQLKVTPTIVGDGAAMGLELRLEQPQ